MDDISGTYHQDIEIEGEVRAADLDGHSFSLRTEDGHTIPGSLNGKRDAAILEALRYHETLRVHIRGRGEFSRAGPTLLRITEIEAILLVAPKRVATREADARTFWQMTAEIFAAVPAEEWAKVPKDLAKNFKHYRYGHPKEE